MQLLQMDTEASPSESSHKKRKNQNISQQDEAMDDDEQQLQLTGHRLTLTCLCIDPNNEFAYTGSKDGSIVKWCLKKNIVLAKLKSIPLKEYKAKEKKQQRHHTKHINCLAISSNNKFLASGGWDKQIRIWNPQDLSWIHTFKLHKGEVTALAFRQGHPTLYSASTDRSVMLWTLEDDDNRCYIESLYGHESPITSLDTLKRERVLTSGGRDQTLRIWKIVEQAQTVFECRHESVDIARLIDEQFFVSGGEDGSINVWTTMKRSPVVQLIGAHKPSEPSKLTQGLSYWISALATYSLFNTKQTNALKKRKTEDEADDVLIAKYGTDEESEDDEEAKSDLDESKAGENGDNVSLPKINKMALIASGSCDGLIKIWLLLKSSGKFELKLHQAIECPGFVNDLRFFSNGQKVAAACGQEHRFGRWWKLKNSKNQFKVFNINKF